MATPKPTPPPVVIPPSVGGGIAPNLAADAFGNTAPGQENQAFADALTAAGTGASGSSGLWDTTNDAKYPRVYWGTKYDALKNTPGPMGTSNYWGNFIENHLHPPAGHDTVLSLQDSIAQSGLWSSAFREGISQKMFKAGLVSDPTDWNAVNNAWANVVQDAGLRYAMSGGKSKITPYQMLDIMVGVSGDLKKNAAPKTTTQSTTSFSNNVIDAKTADSLVRAIYHDQIGRDPTPNELATYRVMVTGYTKANPSKTTTNTTQTTDGMGNVTQNVHSDSSGGWTQAGVQEQVLGKTRQDPEYGAYQAATTYYNALQDLMAHG
jgi:hypothetical protein